uniref:Uncharacterized protein n=1 Tax=Salix viminalis TaxID=40686 RepID=A0A6N2N314_SALVM
MASTNPIKVVELNFFYMLPELTRSVFRSVILPKLKHSLSLTLLHFLPVAGNLTWPPHAAKPIISYTPNDGVSLTQYPIPKYLSSLQITLFPNKGFSIGYSTSHAAVDDLLMTASTVHSSEDIGPEYLKRWSGMNQLVGLDARTLKPILSPEVPPSSVRATFEFSHADNKRLRVRVLSQYGKERKPIHLSSFVLSYAYTLVCIAKARGLNKDDKIIFRFPGDCRARLDPPLPTNYFGNCVMHQVGDLDVEALVGDDHGIAYVAQKLAQMVKQLGKGALEGAKEKLAKNTDTSPRTLPIGLTGSPGFDLYGVDFGWGRPEKVEFTMLDRSESISMIDSKDGNGGLEIGLVLKKHHMEIFQTLFVEGLCNDSGYGK